VGGRWWVDTGQVEFMVAREHMDVFVLNKVFYADRASKAVRGG